MLEEQRNHFLRVRNFIVLNIQVEVNNITTRKVDRDLDRM